MRINNNISMLNMFNTLYQGNMSLHSNKLNRSFFPLPGNNAKGTGAIGTEGVQYVNSLKSSSKDLTSALKELSGPAFSNRTITSSDKDAMTVSYSGKTPSSVPQMSVKIEQIASGQQNEGNRLNAKDAYEGAKGINKFAIETGGKKTELSINVASTDTNKDVQQKMADAINKAGVGVKATVATDDKSGASMLKIESEVTGSSPKNVFTVKDVTGNAAALTGANDVAKAGQDAKYSVDGGPTRTSQSNTVNLGSGVSATLKKASDEPVTVSRGKDVEIAKAQVEKMVKSYNSLFSESAQRVNDPKSQNLASRMVNTSKVYTSSLSNIGIGFDNSGKMTIDSKKLDQAAESGQLEKFFTENSGKNYGFTNQLARLSDNVTKNTSNFVSSSLFGSGLGENFSYSSFGDLIQYNYLSTGSIFDFML